MKLLDRSVFVMGGRLYGFKSNHPLEERLVCLVTYLTEGGVGCPPLQEWDGVETCLGIRIGSRSDGA